METTTLSAVHDAILDAFKARFDERIAWYGAYEPIDALTDEAVSAIQAPALLLELESESYDGTADPVGRLAVDCVWNMHCLLTVRTEQLQITLRQMASAVASVILPKDSASQPRRGNRWGLGSAVEWPNGVSALPGRISPGFHGFDERIVRWEQRVYLDDEFPL